MKLKMTMYIRWNQGIISDKLYFQVENIVVFYFVKVFLIVSYLSRN